MRKNVWSCKFQPFNVVKQEKTLMQILIVPHKKSRIAAQSSTFAEFMSLQEKNSWPALHSHLCGPLVCINLHTG